MTILSDFGSGINKKPAVCQQKSDIRAEVLTKGKRGRYVKSKMPDGEVSDIVIDPTIRAAVIHAQGGRYYHPDRLSKETLYKAIIDQRNEVTNFTNV
ncbi:MAG: hypothetical protein KAR85_07070 [Methanosarcinales archaeon]|nr:hypothetical protein [Methanosarcinales archaeon]